MDLGAQTTSDQESRFRRELSPALFPSWQATCNAFGAAIAARPSLIALVGEPGAGKTFTLLAFAAGATGLVANLRSPAQAIEPGTEIDLVDNVDAEAMRRLKPFRGTRVVAIAPGLAQCVADGWPEATIVTIQPMTARDIRLMLDVRRRQLRLPSGTFSLAALARFERHSLGNPRRLDDLLFRSFRLVAANAAARIAPNHVEQAAAQLHAEAGRSREDLPLPDRETVQTIRHPAKTRDPGFAPQDRAAPRRVPANVAAPRREPRTRGARGDRRKPIGHAAISPRRIGRGAYALATGVTLALAAAASQAPGLMPWPQHEPAPASRAAEAPLPPPASVTPMPPLAPAPAPPALAMNRTPATDPGPAAEPPPAIEPHPVRFPKPPDPAPSAAADEAVTAPAAPAEQAASPSPAMNASGAAESARLLALGKALFSINQVADAKVLTEASAKLGNAEAAALLAAQAKPREKRLPQAEPPQTRKNGRQTRR